MKHSLLFLVAVVASTSIVVLPACGDDDAATPNTTMTTTADGGSTGRKLPAPLHPAASCPVTIDTPEELAGRHVPEGSPLEFNSNPPASGAHYPLWANFQEFNAPVPRGYWIHSAEHGAIVLLAKCDGAACNPILEGFRKVRDAIPTDNRCSSDIRVRVVITPDPLLDVPVAAVAWGWTYKADCLDLPTLEAFAKEHYAQGTEDLCASGKTTF